MAPALCRVRKRMKRSFWGKSVRTSGNRAKKHSETQSSVTSNLDILRCWSSTVNRKPHTLVLNAWKSEKKTTVSFDLPFSPPPGNQQADIVEISTFLKEENRPSTACCFSQVQMLKSLSRSQEGPNFGSHSWRLTTDVDHDEGGGTS